MDNRLLNLWQSVTSGNVKQEEIAGYLGLSEKQTSRKLQKWKNEGWLDYVPGHGRGNLSKLKWLKNVEEIYEAKVMTMMENASVETISKYLTCSWSNNSKLRLMNKFRTKLGYNQNNNIEKLVIPRKYPFLTIHPLEAADLGSANIVENVYNRLVFVDEKGVVNPELVHSWDVSETKLRLYLKKDIKFHDGSVLHAEDVVHCLQRLRKSKYFQKLWEPITDICTITPHIVDLYFPNGCSYCLQMLGTMNASIYKEMEGSVYGTGSFFIGENNNEKTTLIAFKDYFQERPLLDVVEFIQVPKDFDVIYRSSTISENRSTFQVESDSGFGVVIMNKFRKSAIQKKDVRDYIHYVIASHRHELNDISERIRSNNQSCLIGKKQNYKIPVIDRPHFKEPIILQGINFTMATTLWLKETLEKEGIPVELKWLSFEESLNKSAKDEVDLFIHSEIFEMNQDFSFFYFLRNGFSPLVDSIKTNETISSYMAEYLHTPFLEWTELNLKVEKALIEDSIMIPLYYEKRQIPFAADLMNIQIKQFGYVDFSKLWVRPNL